MAMHQTCNPANFTTKSEYTKIGQTHSNTVFPKPQNTPTIAKKDEKKNRSQIFDHTFVSLSAMLNALVRYSCYLQEVLKQGEYFQIRF